MKKLSEQNYYQILEVDPKATRGEIIRAHQLAEDTYGSDSIATYSLMAPEDKRRILSKIREAYQILADEESRRLYDQYLIKSSQVSAEKVRSPQPVLSEVSAKALPQDRRGPGLPPAAEESSPGAGSGMYNGLALQKMREQKGLDLKKIAQITKINILYLKLLEEDNYALLPAPVYIKGFLVQYARCLGLPPERVRDEYMTLYTRALSR